MTSGTIARVTAGKIAILLILALSASNAAAAEYGLGLSAKSDNGLVYFPIDVSPRFRIEPHVRYSTEDVQVNSAPGVPTVTAGDTEMLEIGAGAFGLSLPKESIRIYYGARAGYLDLKIINTISADELPPRRIVENQYGYRIAPTLGFEYLFSQHFTLGGEIAYFYQSIHDNQKFGTGHSRFESEGSGTESFLILRYFF